MANLLWGFSGIALRLEWVAPFQTTGLFPQARVVDSAGAVAATVNLSANATIAYLYGGSWTPPNEGQFIVVIDVYTNSGRTTLHESFDSTTMDVRIKEVGGGFRGGALGGGRGLTKADIREVLEDLVEKIAKKVWALKLNGLMASTVLLKKSEFDPKKDEVKTDLEVPKTVEIDYSEIKNLVKQEANNSLQSIERLVANSEGKLVGQIKGEMANNAAEFTTRITTLENAQKNIMQGLIGQITEARSGIVAVVKGLNLAGINQSVTGVGKTLQGKLDNLVALLDQTTASFQEMNHAGIMKVMDQLRTQMEKTEKDSAVLLGELETNSKMLEAFNKEEAKRFRELLAELQVLLSAMAARMDKVNLASVFRGFDVLNTKMGEIERE